MERAFSALLLLGQSQVGDLDLRIAGAAESWWTSGTVRAIENVEQGGLPSYCMIAPRSTRRLYILPHVGISEIMTPIPLNVDAVNSDAEYCAQY